MAQPKNVVRIVDCIGMKATAKAVLVLVPGEQGPRELWFPQSQIHDDSEVWKEGDEGELVISEWIAKEKGLI